MEWQDSGIIVSKTDFNDKSVILGCLTEKHGLYYGVATKRKTANHHMMIGNMVTITWRGRMENHLGRFTIDKHTTGYQFIFDDYKRLSALQSVCALVTVAVSEKEKQERLFIKLCNLITDILDNKPDWLNNFVKFELYLLAVAGFGLELKECTVSKSRENLAYISPKTGKAVAANVGEPYKDKLFKLPSLLAKYTQDVDISEIIHSLDILEFFINKHILPLKNSQMPNSRSEIVRILKNNFNDINSNVELT